MSVSIHVPAYIAKALIVGAILWPITGDWEFAAAYTTGSIFPILIALWFDRERQES